MRTLLAAAFPMALTGCGRADTMVSWLFGLLAFAFLSALLFAKAQPRTGNIASLQRFNRIAWGVAVLAAAAVCIYFWLTTGQSSDSPWWPYLAAVAGSLLAGAVLLLALVWRFIRFRRQSP